MDRPEPTTLHLVSSLVEQTGTLVRQELALARTELSAKMRSAVASASLVAIGGAFALVALVALTAAAIVLLTMHVPAWGACLIVAGAWLAVAAGAITTGLTRLRALDPVPYHAVQALRRVAELPKAGASKTTLEGGTL